MSVTTVETHQKIQSSTLNKMKKLMKIVSNTIFVCLILFVSVAGYFAIQNKVNKQSDLPGQFGMYVVLSGSMSPEFDAKSIVFVKPINPEQVTVGNILTFNSASNTGNRTTHRVVAIDKIDGSLRFTTKGDANNVNDPVYLYPENIVGKVYYTVPYLGVVLNFVQSRIGTYMLVVLPSLVVIIYEIYKLVGYAFVALKKRDTNTQNDFTYSTENSLILETPSGFHVGKTLRKFEESYENPSDNTKAKTNIRKYDSIEQNLKVEVEGKGFQRQFKPDRIYEHEPDAQFLAQKLKEIKTEFEEQIIMIENTLERRKTENVYLNTIAN